MSNIRTRIAPSNTGADIHIGNARTALFSYLFAKQNKGLFIFRIEDSDVARSKPEYADNIANTLQWLGLKADEGYNTGGDFGPYCQTQKLERYKQVADSLIQQGLAYRCYCTQEEIANLRNSLSEKDQNTFRYPGICRDRKDYPANKDYVVRLKTPRDGSIDFDDTVFGKISTPNKENYDVVLMRSSGIPLYNFGCVVDDIDQKITHVIRGRDHIQNTPIQIMIYNALNAAMPKFAHLPMMLGPDGAKLSKRHGSVSIAEYKKAGYTPSGILNYLARFGWGYKNQEVFSMEELLEKFSLEHCGKNDGKFDAKKFSTIQFEHLKTLTSTNDYAQLVVPFLKDKGIDADVAKIISAIPAVKNRAKTLAEAADTLEIFFKDADLSSDVVKKALSEINAKATLDFINFLSTVDNWEEASLREKTTDWLKKNNLAMKDIGGSRILLTGRTATPDIIQMLSVFGKDNSMQRLSSYSF